MPGFECLEELVGKCGFGRYFLNEDCALGPKKDCELACVDKHESYNEICNCNNGSVLTVGLGNNCECNGGALLRLG